MGASCYVQIDSPDVDRIIQVLCIVDCDNSVNCHHEADVLSVIIDWTCRELGATLAMPSPTDLIPVVFYVLAILATCMSGLPEDESLVQDQRYYQLTFHLSNTLNAFIGTVFVLISAMQSDNTWLLVCVFSTLIATVLSFGLVTGRLHEAWWGEVINRVAFAAIHAPLFVRYQELYNWVVFGVVVGMSLILIAVGAVLDRREDKQRKTPTTITVGQGHYIALLLMEAAYDILFYWIVLQPVWVVLPISILLRVEITGLVFGIMLWRFNRWARFRISWLYPMEYFRQGRRFAALFLPWAHLELLGAFGQTLQRRMGALGPKI